ncbi:MAG: class I SAM-dependent methyltransferase [Nitrospinae bacterium]|nr:class I SAM-dependent methyltransferase [Nitrospinota bacterium]
MALTAEEYDNWYNTERGRYISELEKGILLKMMTPVNIQDLEPGNLSLKLENCLDIGCGTGYFTHFLGGLCKNVIGMDKSLDMLTYAIKKHKSKNIKYLIAQAESLPFKDGSFDISISITSINFFKNPAKAISEAVRVSKIKVFLGVLNKLSILSLLKKIKGFFKETSYSDACFYGQREITNIFSEFPQIKGVKSQYTYFLPFLVIHGILSVIERIIPSSIPFGGFMGITGEIEGDKRSSI